MPITDEIPDKEINLETGKGVALNYSFSQKQDDKLCVGV